MDNKEIERLARRTIDIHLSDLHWYLAGDVLEESSPGLPDVEFCRRRDDIRYRAEEILNRFREELDTRKII